MEIRNRFEYACPPQKLYEALADHRSVAQWWTDQSELQSDLMVFHWRPHNWRVVMKPVELTNNECVKWLCTESNMQNTDAWEDSTLSFRVLPNKNGGSILEFLHDNYKSSPCFNECTSGWAFVLGKSLKNYVETGKGLPFENKISNHSTP